MKKPKFYCTQFIDCNSNIKKYQPPDCKEQCNACMDIIIDHHFNKKPQLEIMEITTKQAVDKLTAELKKDPSLFISYQANIAMAVYDLYEQKYGGYYAQRPTLPEMHQLCNDGAIRFLTLLCEDRPNDYVKNGSDLIAEERGDQIVKHGYDVSDDDYKQGELLEAALQCVGLVHGRFFHPAIQDGMFWPWKDNQEAFLKIRRKGQIGRLKVAGAFIAAEIDRMQRLGITE